MVANSPSSSSSMNEQVAEYEITCTHSDTHHKPDDPQTSDLHSVPIPTLMKLVEPSSNKASEDNFTFDPTAALAYLRQVKATFLEQPEVYHRFLDIMKIFQNQEIDTNGVIERVSTLFHDHTALIRGFSQFLPPGYRLGCTAQGVIQVTTPETITQGEVVLNTAMEFAKKIKLRLERDTYETFLHLITTYQQGQVSIDDLYAQVEPLFEDDLLAELKLFVPKESSLKRKSVDQQQGKKRLKKTEEETTFFEEAKKYIGNHQTYAHFLRVLDLFTQQVLDADALVEQCESYIGGNANLYSQLKVLVGYDPEKTGHGKDVTQLGNLTLQDCGPSYRSVPISWKNQVCSGRDALCWEVLNDDYVSHPTWASEDSGFIASKKNQYEEALHRVEEERYDYDLNIDANLNTFSLLEPVKKHIELMSEADKKTYKLTPGLGGQSLAIYQRVIKKVYGHEQGEEIIDMLHNNPVETVPVVLKKLKEKDEEWKKEQRECNKLWREIEIKNYYKALDYQSVDFKTNDRKITSPRYLVNEIDALRVEQIADNRSSEPQMTFYFKDKDVLRDVTRLLFCYFDRQNVYSPEDCYKMNALIEKLVPVFFDVPELSVHEESDEETEYESSSERSLSARESDSKTYNFFGNIGLYCFFRLFQMCYERLLEMKEASVDGQESILMSKSALELNITSEVFNSIKKDFKEDKYETLLKLIGRFFSNEIDQTVFEECTRYLFGSKAYLMFTIDKLMVVLVRQLHQIVTSIHSQDLLSMYYKHQSQKMVTRELIQLYRVQVAETLGDNDSLYNLAFETSRRELSIQLLEKDDELFGMMERDRYIEYIKNYTNWDIDTPNINRRKMKRPFLIRNLNYSRDEQNVLIKSNLEYKICRNTYHMFYVINTEDSFICK